MKIQHYQRAVDFLSHTGRQLSRNEARCGIMLLIANNLVDNPDFYDPIPPWFCAVYSKNALNAAALRTPPFKLILAHLSGDAKVVAECLVAAISQKETTIPGVNGDKELADRFAELWCRTHNITIQQMMVQRIYRIEKVNNVPLAQGRLRQATHADKEMVTKWSHLFYAEIFGKSSYEPEIDITPNLIHGDIFLWEDQKPVSMAMKSRISETGITVRFVYTPADQRGKSYATSCVSELCRHFLQSGYQFCMLYADLDNPISNFIYKKIGFHEVCDTINYTFTSALSH